MYGFVWLNCNCMNLPSITDEYYHDNPVMDDGRVISTNENQSHVVTVPPRPQSHGYPRATTQQPQPQAGYHHGYQQPPQHQYQGPSQGPSFGAMPSAPPPEEQPYPPAGHSGYGGMNPPPGAYYGEPPPPYSESELPPAKPPVKSWIYCNWRRLFRSLDVFQNILSKYLCCWTCIIVNVDA